MYSLAANGATRSLPISDSCSMDVGKKVDEGSAEAAAYSTSVGWSVDTVDADGWQEIKDYWEKVQGQYVDIVASKAGDDGFIVFHTGYALVGDRVVSVRYSGPSIKTGQVDAALREVVKATDPLPDPVLKRAPEDCAALDDLAAEVMGAPSVITRGSADDELSCTWGTSETALGLSGDTTAQAQEEVSILKDFGARRIDGLGTLAYLADDVDGTTLQWATEGGTLVSIGTATGIRAAKKPLLALAKAAQEYYR